MTRRIQVTWPDPRPFDGREGRPIRILAASDEPDRALEFAANREALGAIDAIVGAGDLEPSWLEFLADSCQAPLAFVVGNHDRGSTWDVGRGHLPEPLPGGSITSLVGLSIAALPWPGNRGEGNARDDRGAWWQALGIARRRLVTRLLGRDRPLLVLSHAPPAGVGDGPDAYHRGFDAYRWLLDRTAPPLWLHGHVTTASVPVLQVTAGPTTLVNVTGSVLVELVSPERDSRPGYRPP